MDQFNRLQALYSEAERTHMTAVELCVRALAIEGFLRRYVHPRGDWSLAYPSDWTLDEHDLAFIKIRAAPGLPEGLVGIHSMVSRTRFGSLDEYVDQALGFLREDAATRGQRFELLSRSHTSLSDGTPAVEVVNVLGTGVVGKSKKLYLLQDGRPLVIDAETYLSSWESLEPQFGQILSSFTVQSH